MNHPTNEELTDLLYGDLPPALRDKVAQHAESCPECTAKLEAWQHVRTDLDSWTLPDRAPSLRRSAASRFAPLRWAAAAVLVLAGIALAHLTAPRPVDPEELRAAIAADLRQEFTTELARARAEQSSRQQDLVQASARALDQLDARRRADYTALRTDLETIALRTQEGFAQLVSADQPAPRTMPNH